MLVGHADAAVHLDALVRRQHERVGTARLGQRHQQREVRIAGVRGAGRGHDGRAAQFDVHEDAHRAVFERLERADGGAELFARLEVGERVVEHLTHAAQHLRAQTDRRQIDDRCENPQPVARGTEYGVAPDLDFVEMNQRRGAAVHTGLRRRGQAGRIRGDEKQAQAVSVVRLARGPSRYDQQIRVSAVEHLDFFARQNPRLASPFGTRGDAVQVVAAARLLISDGNDLLARGNARQPRPFLSVVTSVCQQLAAEQDGREKRLRRQGTAHGFQHDGQVGQAHARAAIIFGNQDARPAERAHCAPQVA